MEQGIYFIKQGIKFGEAHNEIWSSEKTSAAHTRHLRVRRKFGICVIRLDYIFMGSQVTAK